MELRNQSGSVSYLLSCCDVVMTDYLARVDRNIRFHRRVYERRNQQGLFTDWVR